MGNRKQEMGQAALLYRGLAHVYFWRTFRRLAFAARKPGAVQLRPAENLVQKTFVFSVWINGMRSSIFATH